MRFGPPPRVIPTTPAAPLPAASAQVHPARQILSDMAQLLAVEKGALVRLDRDAIEAHAKTKLELDAALQEAVRQAPLEALEKQLLASVREAALTNQLLLAHARSCVLGMLSLLAPGNAPAYVVPGHSNRARSSPPPPPMALNLRR